MRSKLRRTGKPLRVLPAAVTGVISQKSMNKKLHELTDEVNDEKTFLVFIDALLKDSIAEVKAQENTNVDEFGRGPLGWENHTIEQFLEAAQAWAESTNIGATQNLSDASPWRRCAAFLYCGKIYE